VEFELGSAPDAKVYALRSSVIADQGRDLTMLVIDNITAEVRAREAMAQMNEQLEKQVQARTRQLEDANALLMSYAAFVSHDLRSPLTVVKGYLSLLDDGVIPLDAGAGPAIKRAYSASMMMQEMVDNILQLARDEHEGTRGDETFSVDPFPVMRRLASRMRELFAEPRPEIIITALPWVGVSAVFLERVFYNLMTNALK
jgi:signal transduction histidine kinase